MPEWQPPIDRSALSKSIYAQGAEEAMLEKVFERIGVRHRCCVELGAGDGILNSNTARLVREQGWRGVFIEASDYRFAKLQASYGSIVNARLVHTRVQPADLERILDESEIPHDLDLLSIDIDGNDYWVWRALERYRPRVLVIEYNPYYEPPERWVMTYSADHAWDGTTYYGASLESLVALGKDKGYELICCDSNGNNAFFVERSMYDRFGLEDNTPQLLYRPAMYKIRFIGKNTFLTGHPYRYGPGEVR